MAFTLVELMISIALVVLLLLGINQVFKMSSDTIGVGQAYSAIVRDQRAVQAVMEQDAQQWVVDAPVFYIRSELFLSADLDPKKAKRRDRLAFPARGLYRRQTGDSFSSGTSSLEAWVWYGHGTMPGKLDLLCRMAMLLKDPRTINDTAYIDPATTTAVVSALAKDAKGAGRDIYESRYDLAGVTLEQLRANVMEKERQANSTSPPAPTTWWRDLNYAFQCDIHPSRIGGLNAEKLAKASPALLDGCQQFIVEFAGNFVTQDAGGTVTDENPDAKDEVDFYIHPVTGLRVTRWYGLPRDTSGFGVGASAMLPDGAATRWKSGLTDANQLVDVVPVYDVRRTKTSSAGFAPFERELLPNPDADPTIYTCAWAGGSPKLVRVLIQVEDPNKRLQEPQWFEYVLGPQ